METGIGACCDSSLAKRSGEPEEKAPDRDRLDGTLVSDFQGWITALGLALLAAIGAWRLAREWGLSTLGRGVLTLGFVSHLVTGRLAELSAFTPQSLISVVAPWALWVAAREARWRPAILLLVTSGLLLTGPSVDLSDHRFDLVGMGLLVATVGALLAYRAERRSPCGFRTELTLALTFLLLCLWLSRGLVAGFTLALVPGAWSGHWNPTASSPVLAWCTLTLVLLTLALLLSGEDIPRPAGVGLALFFVALGAPGAIDLWRVIPGVRETSPLSLGPLFAIGLGYGAARALERTDSKERALAAVLLLGWIPFLPGDPRPTAPGTAPLDDLRFDEGALHGQPGGERRLDAWIVGELPGTGVVYELELPDGQTQRIQTAVTFSSEGEVSRLLAEEPLDLDALPFGVCTLRLRFEERNADSLVATFHSGAPRNVAWIAIMLAAAVVGVLLSTGRMRALVLVGLVIEGLMALWITNP